MARSKRKALPHAFGRTDIDVVCAAIAKAFQECGRFCSQQVGIGFVRHFLANPELCRSSGTHANKRLFTCELIEQAAQHHRRSKLHCIIDLCVARGEKFSAQVHLKSFIDHRTYWIGCTALQSRSVLFVMTDTPIARWTRALFRQLWSVHAYTEGWQRPN